MSSHCKIFTRPHNVSEDEYDFVFNAFSLYLKNEWNTNEITFGVYNKAGIAF
jgi:hypothetical protein